MSIYPPVSYTLGTWYVIENWKAFGKEIEYGK